MQLTSICFVFVLSGLCTANSFDGNDFDVTRRLGQLESYVRRQDQRIKGLETTVSMQQRLLQMSGVSRGECTCNLQKLLGNGLSIFLQG